MKRTWFRSIHVSIVVLLLVALFPLTQSVGTLAQAAELEVEITADGFDPAEETVAVGTQVTWTNTDTEPHVLISLDGDFDPVEFAPDGTLSITLSVAGTYAFQLDDEGGPTGTIEVTGAVRDLDDEDTPVDTDDAGTAVPELPEVPVTEAGDPRNLTPVETARLAHIHAGTCDELGIVVYSFAGSQSYLLEPETDDRGPVELLVGTAGVAMPDLFTEPFSIHVHESDLNKQNYIACADIGGQPAAPWTEADGLVYELVEQQDSGLAGFASLRQGPEGTTDVSLFLSGDVRTEATPTPATTTTPPTTYVSPTYGYAISYNNTWDVSQEISNNDRDTLILTNGVSYVAFNGAPDTFGGDVADCVSALLQERTSDPNAFNVEVALGPDGEPLVGGTQATGAYAVFNHDYRFSSGVVPYTLYVGCVPLVPGESVLGVVQNSPAADFESQVGPREGLIRGLVLDQ
jgi:plastocyanin